MVRKIADAVATNDVRLAVEYSSIASNSYIHRWIELMLASDGLEFEIFGAVPLYLSCICFIKSPFGGCCLTEQEAC